MSFPIGCDSPWYFSVEKELYFLIFVYIFEELFNLLAQPFDPVFWPIFWNGALFKDSLYREEENLRTEKFDKT